MAAAAGGQKYCLKWHDYHSTVTGVFELLRSSAELVDVSLCCEGRTVQAHKIILSACSVFFRQLFKSNPCQHPIFFLKGASFSDLTAILEFVYSGKVNVHQDQLSSFLETAELLQIKGLSPTADQKQRATANSCGSVESPDCAVDSDPLPPDLSPPSVRPPPRLTPRPSSPRQLPAVSTSPPPAKRRRSPHLSTDTSELSQETAVWPQRSLQQQQQQQQHVYDARDETPAGEDVKPAVDVTAAANDVTAAANDVTADANDVTAAANDVTAAELLNDSSLDAKMEQVEVEADDVESADDAATPPPSAVGEGDEPLPCSTAVRNNNNSSSAAAATSSGSSATGEWDSRRGAFRCPYCSRLYTHLVSLGQHMKVHQGDTTCHLCGKVLSRTTQLRIHLRQIHGVVDQAASPTPTPAINNNNNSVSGCGGVMATDHDVTAALDLPLSPPPSSL